VTILTPGDPIVTLNRRQSGVGSLLIEAACSPAVGDLRLGCAYALTTGASSILSHADGMRLGPKGSDRPVIVAGRERFEQVEVDLRQVRTVERLLVYSFSGDRSPLAWGGTLRIATFGGAEIELSIERPEYTGVYVLLSAYSIDGELILRAELDPAGGTVREACRAYGYERITWLDDRLPAH